jgi:predicted transcriptional regulator of viral defense system
MPQIHDLLTFLKKHGPCRVRDIETAGFRRQDLRHLIRYGSAERLARGIYQVAKAPILTYPSFTEVFLRSPSAVLCLLSALSYHRLTTQLPHQVWIAIAGSSRAPKLAYPPLRIVRFSQASFTKGIESHRVDGVTLRVYNVAKTVADLFKMRNKVGIDVAMEALREALKTKKATRTEILKMARVCRVDKVMQPYLEMEALS